MLPAREFHTRRLAMELNCSHTCKESQGYHLRVLCSKLPNFAIDNFRVKYNTISESSDSNILQETKGKKIKKKYYTYIGIIHMNSTKKSGRPWPDLLR